MTRPTAARDWLTIVQLPQCAHEPNLVELVWSHLKRSPANLAQLTTLAQLAGVVAGRGPSMLRAGRPGLDLA